MPLDLRMPPFAVHRTLVVAADVIGLIVVASAHLDLTTETEIRFGHEAAPDLVLKETVLLNPGTLIVVMIDETTIAVRRTGITADLDRMNEILVDEMVRPEPRVGLLTRKCMTNSEHCHLQIVRAQSVRTGDPVQTPRRTSIPLGGNPH